MDLQKKEFEACLRNGGWFEGRDVSEEFSICSIDGIFEKAVSILSEFGDLTVGESGAGVDCAKCTVSFERKFWRLADEETCAEAQQLLFMVAETVRGPMQIYVSPEGAFHLESEEGLERYCNDFQDGLCSLLLGVELQNEGKNMGQK